jgi:hypothetical protein
MVIGGGGKKLTILARQSSNTEHAGTAALRSATETRAERGGLRATEGGWQSGGRGHGDGEEDGGELHVDGVWVGLGWLV